MIQRLVFTRIALVNLSRRSVLFWRLFLPILLLQGGCSKKTPSQKNQSIRINFCYSPLSIDPRISTDPITTTMSFMLYEGLTRLEPDGSISFALAERVKISKDKKKYLFYLRESMWSDGTPLTAYHFEASWKRILDPKFPSKSAHLLFPIKNGENAKRGKCPVEDVGVKAIDEKTLLVHLARPTPYFLQLTSFATYFPVPFNGDQVPHPTRSNETLSSGPFLLSSWKEEDEIVVLKNPYYWNAAEVKLEKIHISMINDEATALNLFDQGFLDFNGGLISTLPLDAIPTLRKRGILKQRPIASTTFCTFNVQKFPFNNVHIRKAFSYAINRKLITENLFHLFDDIATGPVPTILKKGSSLFVEDQQKELAIKYFHQGLLELGITKEEFPEITYNYFPTELHKNLAITLQNFWKETLGLNVKLQAQEFKTHLSKLCSQDYSIAQMSWIGQYCDPMSFLERFDGKNAYRNYSGWESPDYSRLLEKGLHQEKKAREETLEQAEYLLVDEMPLIPLYHFHLNYVKNPSLKNLSISPLGDIQFHKAYLKIQSNICK
ncbi:MAG: peptide ABC transporter substrate-binding protein [Chlamydiia bacterium]|nr:peptide ABC transporter substrate-binding protein [Chlamydiia bacterium]